MYFLSPVDSKSRRVWECVLIFLGAIFYLFVFSHGIHGDGASRYEGMRHFLNTGEMKPVVYSFVGPLVSSPLILLGKFFKDDFWWVSRFNAFVFLLSVWWFSRTLAKDWPAPNRRMLVLLLFTASMFPKHSTDYYSEVFSACTIAVAILLWSERRFVFGVIALCLSVWNTPGTLIGGALVILYFLIKEKKLRFVAAFPMLPAGIMLESYLKFGQLSPEAYVHHAGFKNLLPYSGQPGFSYPFFFGVLSVIFSFGKGLLFFVPGLVGLFHAGLWKLEGKERDFFVAGLLYLGGLIVVYARWWAWHGDWFWGPRFYLFASFLAPVMLALMARRLVLSTPWKTFWVAAVLLSIWVGVQGVLFGQDFLEDCYRDQVNIVDFLCHYIPEYSVLWRPFIVLPSLLVGRRIGFFIYFLLVAVTVLYSPVKHLIVQGAGFLRDNARKLAVGWRL